MAQGLRTETFHQRLQCLALGSVRQYLSTPAVPGQTVERLIVEFPLTIDLTTCQCIADPARIDLDVEAADQGGIFGIDRDDLAKLGHLGELPVLSGQTYLVADMDHSRRVRFDHKHMSVLLKKDYPRGDLL